LGLFDAYVEDGLQFVRKKCRESIPSCNINLVQSLMALFQSLYSEQSGVKVKTDTEEDLKTLANMIFIFSYVWSIGGNIEAECQDMFDSFMREKFENLIALPGAQSLYHYYVDIEDKVLRKWADLVPEFTYNPKLSFSQLIVPTVDSVRYCYLLEKLIRQDLF
jgi:dynein heavy chain